jgi:Spy/CpxP family protein refolding chaperone
MRRGHGGRALFRGVDLTEAQKQQIKTIRDKYQPQMRSLREQIRAQRQQSGAERQRPDSATLAQVRSLMQRQEGEIRAVLTPDQQKTFDANVAQMREHSRDGMRKRRGDRPAQERSGSAS